MNMETGRIITLANDAAQSAYDAFVYNELPSAEGAYEFTRQFRYEDCEGTDEQAQAVWDSLALSISDWVIFRAAYAAALVRLTGEQ